MTFLFDIFTTLGFGLALLLVFRIQKNLLGHPSRFFLCLFLFVYILAGTTNVMRQLGISSLFDRYEYYAQLLFPPLFLFFIFPIFSLYVFSIFMKHDFVNRLKAEASLKESESKYRNLFEDSLEGICISRQNRVIEANKAFLDLFGYNTINEIIEKPFFGVFQEDKDMQTQQPLVFGADQLSPGTPCECRIIRKTGEFRDVEISASAIMRGGQKQYIQITIIDTTAKKHAAEIVRRAKEEWERTFDTVPDLIAILDEQNKFTRVNKKLAEKLQVTSDSLIGKDFHKVVHGLDSEVSASPAILDVDPKQTVEIYEERQDGFYLVSISPLTNKEGKFIGSVRVARDITKLKRAEQKLESARAFLQSIIDGVTDSIMVIGTDYRVRLINKTATQLHAVTLPLNDTHFCHKITHHEDTPCHGNKHPCPLQTVAETKKPVVLVHNHKKSDGAVYVVEIAASPLLNQNGEVTGIIEIGRDITQKLQLEKEEQKFKSRLFQQQKNQSIATLARGIAHDFNNLLGTVLGNVELFQMGSESREVECNMVETIGSTAQHMTDLTRQLLAYAEEGAYKQETLNLNKIIHESLKICRRSTTAKIEIITELAPDLWPVVADPGQMSQMLVNILTNGFEAMAEIGGTLTIRSANLVIDADWECSRHNMHKAGNYITITIADTGPGIPAEVADHIFEPFVTTKFLGRGLGLAAAIGIVKSHGGCVSVIDNTSVGAAFRVLLPLTESENTSS